MRKIIPWLALLIAFPAFGADVAISGLPAADALGGTETTPVVQGGVTKKATATQLSTYVRSQTTKSDVGLGNVDNTSNATERAATATLTNKTMSGAANTFANIALASLSLADNVTWTGLHSWSNTERSTFAGPITVSGTGAGSTAALIVSSTSPSVTWDDTDSSSRRWNARVNSHTWILESTSNSDLVPKQVFNVQRTAGSTDITGLIYGNSTDNPLHRFRGEISADTLGKGISIREGSNARMGVATLVAGAVTVANTSVTANTGVFAFSQVDGGTPGWLRNSARTAGTSFTITSSSGSDTSTIKWILVEPAP